MPYSKSTKKKYGENPMKKKSTFKMKGFSGFKQVDPPGKVKKASSQPTASEKAIMKAHLQALQDNPDLYKDSFYDNRRQKAAEIKSKYPGYKF